MINLLADERKDDIRAARTNVILSRYIAILLMAIVFILAVLYGSYTILQNTKQSAETTISSNDVQADVYSETQTQVNTLSSKLTETRATLDQEIKYSKVLTTLGQTMPEGTIIESLELNETSFNGSPVEIKAFATTNETAAAIGERLRTSPLITQVSLQGTNADQGIDGYPVAVTLSVVFNRAGAK